MKAFAGIRPKHLAPVTPAIAEPTTGLTMGQSAEKMAQENGITREAQDRWALRSHQLAWAGSEDGRLTREIAPVYVDGVAVTRDNGIRGDTSLEKLSQLKPAFETLDVVITGGIWGSGRRKGLLSSLIVAVRDREEFKTVGKVGTAEQIAECAAWLVSPAADFVHGETLIADGGILMR